MTNKWDHYQKLATPIKDLVEPFAKENGLDPKMVSDIVDQYYQNLNDAIREMKHPLIIIPFLGRLRLSKGKTEKAIEAVKKFLKEEPNQTIEYKIRKVRLNEKRLITLEKGLHKLNESNEKAKAEYIKRLEKSKKDC
jgi:hypothetical protein